MVVTAMMPAVTAMMRDAAEMMQAEMVQLTPTFAMTGGTTVSPSTNNPLTAMAIAATVPTGDAATKAAMNVFCLQQQH